ncbi:hypothetical protein HPB49_003303 [Dermacentor silvarum]|uniref:Uncharacterized protein n=1 Tax=Dermacentor silvarum TaxID=543639 RepID=A0ACB8DAH2_DERSI|nr:hypothetical protein HPB49_003303 [Dermacentor silvarum]
MCRMLSQEASTSDGTSSRRADLLRHARYREPLTAELWIRWKPGRTCSYFGPHTKALFVNYYANVTWCLCMTTAHARYYGSWAEFYQCTRERTVLRAFVHFD